MVLARIGRSEGEVCTTFGAWETSSVCRMLERERSNLIDNAHTWPKAVDCRVCTVKYINVFYYDRC